MSVKVDRLRKQLGLVLDIVSGINAATDLPFTFYSVCKAAEAFGWERAALVVWDEIEGGTRTTLASAGADTEAAERLASSLAEAGPLLLEALKGSTGALPLTSVLTREEADEGGLAFAVSSAGELHGVFAVELYTFEGAQGWTSSADPMHQVERLAELAAVAIRTARVPGLRGSPGLTDVLTNLANRRGFEEGLRREVERAYRATLPLSVLMVDLDRLDRINSAHGMEAGDAAVRAVAEVLREGLRQVDMAAHVGGGEFYVLLPGATTDGAREVAERLRCAVAAANVPNVGAITATFGVAVLAEHAANGAGLVQAASAALDLGKRRGRNRVSVALPIGKR